MNKILKITALVLTLALCFVSVTASATDVQISNDLLALFESGELAETRGTSTSIITSGTVYNIVSAKSGKYLNVHYGYDSNGTNVYQWTADGSDEQQFKVVYDSATASYKIYAMCSSNGTNRVLDIERNGAAVAAGQNVEIWTPVDPTAQNWTLTNMGNGYFKIAPKANTSLALTVYGTSNGTGSGRTSTSAGNVYLSVYDTYISQLWTFEEVTNVPVEQPYGRLEAIYGNTIVGYAWRSDLPNVPIYVKVYITDSYGDDVPGSPFTVEANIYRDYLQAAGYGNGVHGFEVYFDWTTVPDDVYTIEAFAINHTGGTVGLVASPKTVTVDLKRITISNYVDQGYKYRFHSDNLNGYNCSDIKTYNTIVGEKFNSIFGLTMLSTYSFYTSAADTCKITGYGSVTSENLGWSCIHPNGHLTTEALRIDLGEGTNVNPKVLWTGHDLDGNPPSDSAPGSCNVIITRGHTYNEITGENYNDAKIREENLLTLMHEISHQLGAYDHYCRKDNVQQNAPCSNPNCDLCRVGLTQKRACLMSCVGDVENGDESSLYCSDCISIINAHIADHHD
ncbi:MAG: RICIN domain-containing protein [Clostridia bacterium]|nr:RICIN domain-containing protein [Clostridia bacterium]